MGFTAKMMQDLGAMGGRDGAGDGRSEHEQLLLGEQRDEMHPHWTPLRAGRPGGAAGDVVGGWC
jgi:hypothetical protein